MGILRGLNRDAQMSSLNSGAYKDDVLLAFLSSAQSSRLELENMATRFVFRAPYKPPKKVKYKKSPPIPCPQVVWVGMFPLILTVLH